MGKKLTVSELENLRNRRFGNWIVLDCDPVFFAQPRKKRTGKRSWHWNCECVLCGKVFLVHHQSLLRGISTACKPCSCGIANRIRFNKFRAFPAHEDIGLNGFYNRYVRGAKSRGLAFELSPEVFRGLVTDTCYYCGFKGREYVYNGKVEKNSHIFFGNGIDRVDNNLGYTEDNCVTCCNQCNNKKLALPRYILDKVIAHQDRSYRQFISSDGMLYL